jgi:hypothetical protein
MRKYCLTFSLLFLLSACGKTAGSSDQDAFFDPVIQINNGLPAMEAEYDVLNFAEYYTFEYIDMANEVAQPSDICWFNGALHIADDVNTRITVLNADNSITPLYLSAIRLPLAMAAGADGNLYVVQGGMPVSDGMQYSVSVFDKNYDVTSEIAFKIPGNSETIRANDIAITENGEIYLTLSASENEQEGKIYKISPQGEVLEIAGNKSFGKLASVPGGFAFVNDGFPYVLNRDTMESSMESGVSAIYKLSGGDGYISKLLPVNTVFPFTEEELGKWAQVFTELEGAPPNEEDWEIYKDGISVFAQIGYGGICFSDEKIIVVNQQLPVIYCFDLELNYLWTQKMEYDSYDYWDLEARYREYKEGRYVLPTGYTEMCADPSGGIYVINRTSSGYGIVKGTPGARTQ